ncbi:MAG: ArsB/NhaD family transporter [Desulfobacteraceae bacterium]|jgi:Na+/H+ antiporter NhaD/arsenite permease-like protein
MEKLIPIVVFIVVYLLISFEVLNKAVAAILGVAILIILGSTDLHTAIGHVDFETILLLMGMMMIVAVLKKSGFFNILTVKVAILTGGSPLKILIFFSVITAVLSAFLDNVTTVLIMVPMVIELTRSMGLDPRFYVIIQAIVSNLGGTATLIGDPPNIIIGSKVGLTFNQFLYHLPLPVVITFIGVLGYCYFRYHKNFTSIDTNLAKLFTVALLTNKIKNDFHETPIVRSFLSKSVICVIITILLFLTQTFTGLKPGIVAVMIAMIMLIVTHTEVEEILIEVEWSTLLFFSGLFILVGTLEEKGIIEWIARNIFLRIGDNPYLMVLTVLWVSGIVSGFLDNIPFTITMIPIVNLMLKSFPIPNHILWWALSMGACFGGNLTLIGASANIVSAGTAKRYGYDISFTEFIKLGFPITLLTLLIASAVLCIYLWWSLL